jgi:hypothetical protein
MENFFHFFPLWKRGMKGDLTAFQKAKLLRFPHFVQSKKFSIDNRMAKAYTGAEIFLPIFRIPMERKRGV